MKEQFPSIQEFNKMLETAGIEPLSQERYEALRSQHGSKSTVNEQGDFGVEEMYFDGHVRRPQLMVAAAEKDLGEAVARQLDNILAGEPFAEQNKNALRMIAKFAYKKGEKDLAQDISDYLGM